MNKALLKSAALGALILTGTLTAGQAALADQYEVSIQSLTLGQPIAPSLFVTHGKKFSLFEVGPVENMDEEQYFGLATAAETGDPGVLADAIDGALGVEDYRILLHPNGGGIPPILFPGNDNSLSEQGQEPIEGDPGDYFSAVAMLGGTNDAFYGVRNVKLPKKGSVTVYADSYDAGSEANSERFTDTPPGGNTDEDGPDNIADGGEGYIHVHAGIHGVPAAGGGWNGEYLNPTAFDWRNPVVAITITHLGDDGEDE